MSQSLNADKIGETLVALHARIAERFPDSGLARVCGELVETAAQTARRARVARRPNLPLRITVLMVIAAFVYGLYSVGEYLYLTEWSRSAASPGSEITQGLESMVNLVILAAAALWFLITVEERLRRRSVLRHLHELRSFAHVVDMHQLTKDPVAIQSQPTASSPLREMSEFELARYLDYCSEMLSLIGKLAALYGERTGDTQIIAAASDVETLTTNMGRKIWQKIMIVANTDVPGTGR